MSFQLLGIANQVRTFQLLLILIASLLSNSSFVCTSAYSFQRPPSIREVAVTKSGAHGRFPRGLFLQSTSESNHPDDQDDALAGGADVVEPVYEGVVRMDDGGSDLTDRFKYKVNALMGVFDPQSGAVDDEYQSGNIVNALLNFPTQYSFNCVGRTNGDEATRQAYVDEIKGIVSSLSGDEEGMTIRITPRGKNFTRITLQVTVDSVAIINSIHGELERNNKTVMQY